MIFKEIRLVAFAEPIQDQSGGKLPRIAARGEPYKCALCHVGPATDKSGRVLDRLFEWPIYANTERFKYLVGHIRVALEKEPLYQDDFKTLKR